MIEEILRRRHTAPTAGGAGAGPEPEPEPEPSRSQRLLCRKAYLPQHATPIPLVAVETRALRPSLADDGYDVVDV